MQIRAKKRLLPKDFYQLRLLVNSSSDENSKFVGSSLKILVLSLVYKTTEC